MSKEESLPEYLQDFEYALSTFRSIAGTANYTGTEYLVRAIHDNDVPTILHGISSVVQEIHESQAKDNYKRGWDDCFEKFFDSVWYRASSVELECNDANDDFRRSIKDAKENT